MKTGIVGAGLSGLMAAQHLHARGHDFVIVDKGRSVGGRLATRRVGDGRADHGAQFFTVRSPEFRRYVDRWLSQDLVYVWTHGWSDPADGHPRYAVRNGMNQLAKALAAPLEAKISLSWEATRVESDGNGYVLTNSEGASLNVDRLLLTAPVPQSLALLDAGNVHLGEEERAALARIEYAPCLCLLVHVDGPALLPAHGARQTPDELITWVADNKVKGISPADHILTVHIGPDFSRAHYRAADAEVLALLEPQVLSVVGPHAVIRQIQVKWWRYSLPTTGYPQPYLQATGTGAPLFFAGDAFGGSRVEGAVLSGLAAGQAIADQIAIRG